MQLEIGQDRRMFATLPMARTARPAYRRTEARTGLPLAIVAALGIIVWLSVCLLLAPLLQGAVLAVRAVRRIRRRRLATQAA